jgi:hypothetical protein
MFILALQLLAILEAHMKSLNYRKSFCRSTNLDPSAEFATRDLLSHRINKNARIKMIRNCFHLASLTKSEAMIAMIAYYVK